MSVFVLIEAVEAEGFSLTNELTIKHFRLARRFDLRVPGSRRANLRATVSRGRKAAWCRMRGR
jgi:hypothetical protein